MANALHDLQVLLALYREPRHGYAILADIAERTRGDVRIGASSLYAIIRRLLRDGLIDDVGDRAGAESKGPPRRYYRITEVGRRVAQAETDRFRAAVGAAETVLGDPLAKLDES